MAVHPDAPEPQAKGPKQGSEQAPFENLALLYQGLLTGIVRLKAQRQHISDSESFRRRTKATLQEVERVAVASGYDHGDVRDTHLAVVALLDAVVLHSKDPVRAEWERMPLALELFGYADAGVVFFEKLEQFRSRRNSQQLADVLEAYLLCLLLGFEGRYSGAQRGALDGITESLRMRIDDIRGRKARLSPSGELPPAPPPVPPAERRHDRLRLVTLGLAVFTLLCFLVLRWDLVSMSVDLRKRLF